MDKFFRVKEDSRYYEQYMTYEQCVQDILSSGKIDRFLEEYEIPAKEYMLDDKQLAIIPAETDMTSFGDQLTNKRDANGVRYFRRTSPINKAWQELWRDQPIPRYPHPLVHIEGVDGGYKTRLVRVGNALYLKVDGPDFFKADDSFAEISGVEFYKAIEG